MRHGWALLTEAEQNGLVHRDRRRLPHVDDAGWPTTGALDAIAALTPQPSLRVVDRAPSPAAVANDLAGFGDEEVAGTVDLPDDEPTDLSERKTSKDTICHQEGQRTPNGGMAIGVNAPLEPVHLMCSELERALVEFSSTDAEQRQHIVVTEIDRSVAARVAADQTFQFSKAREAAGSQI